MHLALLPEVKVNRRNKVCCQIDLLYDKSLPHSPGLTSLPAYICNGYCLLPGREQRAHVGLREGAEESGTCPCGAEKGSGAQGQQGEPPVQSPSVCLIAIAGIFSQAGQTALMWACRAGCPDIVTMLLVAGADANARSPVSVPCPPLSTSHRFED